ncbi:MAG: hypothetical protein R3308_06440 [Thiohalobacterales bacterium]|nr:hypothetical protein [Thiohalobacterales bacterium]
MKHLYCSALVSVLAFAGLVGEVSANSWTCQNAGFIRQVVIFYPDAPVQLPCKVFYAKPDENALPRALWEAKNTHDYCEQKAAELVEKLDSHGWHCYSDEF